VGSGPRRGRRTSPTSELKKWQRELAEKRGWETIRDGLEVKCCPGPGGMETFLLCRSADRAQKEAAMHERFSTRIEKGLQTLARRIERSKRPLDRLTIGQQIGRLLAVNRRSAAKYRVELKDASDLPAGFRLAWSVNQAWAEWARLSEGAYVLRSNVADWSAEDLWRTYVQLTEAEAAFRIHKSDLRIRPIWHQREERVDAHILICFLAYALWKLLEGWCQRAGLGTSARRVLYDLKRISAVDVVLPVEDGPELKLRCVLRPDKDQAILLDRLGLRIPSRLIPNPRLLEM
jgi:hypothetical protein